MARASASRFTTPPLRIPADGEMPAPSTRTRPSSSRWPTRVQILVVPMSRPTKILSSGASIVATSCPLVPVVGAVQVFHADQRHPALFPSQGLGDGLIHAHLDV